MPTSYAQRSDRNCEIMLADTAPYCAGHVTLLTRGSENSKCKIVHYHSRPAPFVTQLLPIYCRYMYAIFVSVVGGALCITMAGPARSAPFRNLTIAYLLPAYWQDVVSTSEVRS